ncbi:hypothetical protein L228DRAFT_241853 [Xylona heveae TC161]|uniref:Ubiquitin-like 1-activating enzyme E1A n=1 Tax=Xylona heveae (strain CBS 132557 / TC161) TaxID=1328760 RepID=A0A164ZJN1_XYLHT|nr:hypothetical protein L228DRAFT_241853 [Xylona heveae TC161]KZF19181.1 hypothetical protein L228DRAFT_241853 [Xylona heveae TC161]
MTTNGTNGALPAQGLAGETIAAIAQAQTISADEIALYDRQIRLWGVKAQEKLRTANILLISMKALANEVAKNLVLAGIGSLTIVDHELVSPDDLCSQFFITDDDVGKNRADAAAPHIRKLNPRVTLHVDQQDIRLKPQEFFGQFSLIIATDLDFETLNTVNAAARLSNRPFYAAGTHGFYGYIFADLISHDFVIEREKSNVPTIVPKIETATRTITASTTKEESGGKTIELVTKRELYSPLLLANSSPLPLEYVNNRRRLRQVTPLLTCLKALWEYQKIVSGTLPSHSHADLELFTTLATEKHRELQLPPESLRSDFLRRFLQNLGSEIAPVTAFLGGQLAQDVINVLGQREQPIQNLLLFDGEESRGPVYALHPIFPTLDAAAVPAPAAAPTTAPAPVLDTPSQVPPVVPVDAAQQVTAEIPQIPQFDGFSAPAVQPVPEIPHTTPAPLVDNAIEQPVQPVPSAQPGQSGEPTAEVPQAAPVPNMSQAPPAQQEDGSTQPMQTDQ